MHYVCRGRRLLQGGRPHTHVHAYTLHAWTHAYTSHHVYIHVKYVHSACHDTHAYRSYHVYIHIKYAHHACQMRIHTDPTYMHAYPTICTHTYPTYASHHIRHVCRGRRLLQGYCMRIICPYFVMSALYCAHIILCPYHIVHHACRGRRLRQGGRAHTHARIHADMYMDT